MDRSSVEVSSQSCLSPGQQGTALAGPRKSLRSRKMNRILAAVCLMVALIAAPFLIKKLRTSRVTGIAQFDTSHPGTPSALRLTGKTGAVQARAILAPILSGQQVGTLTIIKLAQSGTRVKRGELLAEFDRQTQLRDFIDKQVLSNDENDKVIEEQAKEAIARAKDETEIKEAESRLSKTKLEMQKVEILSSIDAEKARQDLDEAQVTLTQLKETFSLKRKAAQASIRILEIQRDRTRETMLHAQANAALMQIHSPIDGVVVFNTIWKQGSMGEVQEGDQVRPGIPFMQVVDPSVMEVQVPVNQEDLFALRLGEKVRVHLDAYPNLVFQGQLDSIDPMGQRGAFSPKLRSFSATFSIQGNDSRLMPDLSAAIELDPTGRDKTASSSR